MEIRRILLFIVLSVLIVLGWQFMVANFLPPPARNAPPAGGQAAKDDPQADAAGKADAPANGEIQAAERPAEDAGQQERTEFLRQSAADERTRDVTLGSADADARYLMRVGLTTRGAAIETIQLGGKTFRELRSDEPLSLVNPVPSDDPNGPPVYRTFQTSVHEVDGEIRQLAPDLDLSRVNWEIADQGQADGHDYVTFRFRLPGGRFELLKRYSLGIVPENVDLDAARKTHLDGYLVHLTVTVRNVSDEPQAVSYELLGPVGTPLENEENTRKFRDVKWEYIRDDGGTKFGSPYTAADIADEKIDPISAAVLYAGVDMQYFAALVFPTSDPAALAAQPQPQTFVAQVEPLLIRRGTPSANSDVSVKFLTNVQNLAPGETLEDDYTLYSGPKREALLDPLLADDVIEYGWFSPLGRGMVWLLNFFHNTLLLPYGIAIICLTVVVRGILFPLSRKQAINAQKMKELQPKIAELKKKHGSDKEKFARAQMELFRKHDYNVLSGCLPILFQFPIFIALYNALYTAVDLRRAEFLWIDNLGAPDELFPLGFTIPLVGWTHFNLLPIVTVVLFILQQKMFMPEPNPNDEQAMMQHRVMKFMTIFLGFLFYRVPAGLCIYFIASSLWGLGERQFLNLSTGATTPASEKKMTEAGPAPAKSFNGDDGRNGAKRSTKKSKPRR